MHNSFATSNPLDMMMYRLDTTCFVTFVSDIGSN